MTCCFHGETSNGLTCLSDEERSEGVVGMTVVSLGRSLGLLVPRGKGPSAMVMLEVKLKEVENPVEEQMRKFRESRKKLEVYLFWKKVE